MFSKHLHSIVIFAIISLMTTTAYGEWQTAQLLNDTSEAGHDVKEPKLVGSINGGFHAVYRLDAGHVRYRRYVGSLQPVRNAADNFCFNAFIAEAMNGDVHITWESWTGDTPEVGWSYTTDYVNFSAFQEITQSGGQSKFPLVAPFGMGGSDDVVMSYWRSNTHSLQYSHFDGSSWNGDLPTGQSCGHEYGVHGIARSPVDGSVWRAFDNSDYVAIMRYNGTGWETPINLYYQGFHARQKVAVNDAGQVMVLWDMSFDDGNIYSILYTPSQGIGQRQIVAHAPDTWNIALTSIPGSNDFYAAYTTNGSLRAVGKRWSNGNWGSVETISNGLPESGEVFKFNPVLSADPLGSGKLYCAFEYWGSGKPQAYYNINPAGTGLPYEAVVADSNLPDTIAAGETVEASISYLNTGTEAWDTTNTRLGTSNPRNRSSAFYTASDWIGANRPTAADTAANPDQVATFTFLVTAPTSQGQYTEDFELVQESVTWFEATGDDFTWNVTVTEPNEAPTLDSLILSDDQLIAGANDPYRITMSASDGNGGGEVRVMRCLINYQGDQAGQYRGYLAWGKTEADIGEWGGLENWQTWPVNSGTGYWGIRTDTYGGTNYITPASATENVNGDTRTVMFDFSVKLLWQTNGPHASNDISGMCADRYEMVNWQNFDLNFEVYPLPIEIPDFDRDTDVDIEDFGQFQLCFSGPNVHQTDPYCEPAKLDADTDVDQEDFNIFINCLSGADVTTISSCLN